MQRERWRKVDELFAAALELPPEERERFLAQSAGSDSALREEVRKMLAYEAEAGSFIEEPAIAPSESEDAGATCTAAGGAAEAAEGRAWGGFEPGDRIGDRYRVVALLGRGGMGEVYRADDLKLRQPVALKFLPASVEQDAAALARFYREVRVARQISHRHVCRVYDVAETQGRHFLSMEYVPGEDLASLLRRIVRPPQSKAIEMARQLCAGLAAIHEGGILHRDLKPANVMIDDWGNVRITDFGVAIAEKEGRGRDVAGTPAYMSPEQLAGSKLTTRSDIYSLGIILYEIFTGKRAFEAASLQDLIRLRRTNTTPTNPSRIVTDLDPVIERVILRCLDLDPAQRPASAIEVSAALPGGDPLAAALAAGETPSPEMVAAAPKRGSLSLKAAGGLLTLMALSFGVTIALSGKVALHRMALPTRPPAVLADQAENIVRDLGYGHPGDDRSSGFYVELDYLDAARANPKLLAALKSDRPPGIVFWYRQSRLPLEAWYSPGVDFLDPPNEASGMLRLLLDSGGNLTYFEAVPDPAGEGEAKPGDWQRLFRAAGLEMEQFTPTSPRWAPPYAYDTRAAWRGTMVGQPDLPIRVEAAYWQGRPTYFEVIPPWRQPLRNKLLDWFSQPSPAVLILGILFVGVLAGGSALAWRNLKLGRGDRRGAFRLALFFIAVRMVAWVFTAHHSTGTGEITNLLMAGLESGVFWGCFVGVLYLALEPLFRRNWPERLISWTRILGGEFRDPLVGRDMLIGISVGALTTALTYLAHAVPAWLQSEAVRPHIGPGIVMLATPAPSVFINQVMAAIAFTFIVSFLLLFLYLLLRREWLALLLGWMLLSAPFAAAYQLRVPAAAVPLAVATAGLIVIVLARVGLVAAMAVFLTHHMVVFFPVTSDPTAWYAPRFIADLLLLTGLAGWGAWQSVAAQPLLGRLLGEDPAG